MIEYWRPGRVDPFITSIKLKPQWNFGAPGGPPPISTATNKSHIISHLNFASTHQTLQNFHQTL